MQTTVLFFKTEKENKGFFTLKKKPFYAELKQSRQNMYPEELGLLQYPGNGLFSVQY